MYLYYVWVYICEIAWPTIRAHFINLSCTGKPLLIVQFPIPVPALGGYSCEVIESFGCLQVHQLDLGAFDIAEGICLPHPIQEAL